jgi:uncharacterized metal-binding protein YceD (DUF177 family)
MDTQRDYIKHYRTDPFSLVLEIRNMKDGWYHIDGVVSAENWQKMCKTAGVAPAGDVVIDAEIEKLPFKMRLMGRVKAKIEQTCIRSLQPLKTALDIQFNEEIFLTEPREGEKADEVLTGDTFDFGYFIKQIIQLDIDPYPVHQDTLNIPKGEFGFSDGLEEEVKMEKNPFSVLKDLKSD